MADNVTPVYYSAPGSTPSVASFKKYLGLDHKDAVKVKTILTGKIDLMTCDAANRRQCEAYNSHEPRALALEALNALLGTYGVEYIESNRDGFRRGDQYGIEYLNTGDPYNRTIMYLCDRGVWRIGCWGEQVDNRKDLV